MKKYILLIAVLLAGMVSMAQTNAGSYTAFGGTTAAADTIKTSTTRTYTLNLVKYQLDQGVNVMCYIDNISGTTTLAIKAYWSNDGTNITATAADSVSKSHASDFVYMKNFTTAGGKYLILKVIPTSATQVGRFYGWVNCYTK
jgi:hypothetical protein